MKTLCVFLLASAVSIAAPIANAATVTFSAMPTTASSNLKAAVVTGRVVEGSTGSRPKSRSPWQESGKDVGVIYTAKDSFYTAVFAGSSALYNVGTSVAASMVWGSPDTYNKIEFLLNGTVIDSFVITRRDDIRPATVSGDGAFAKFTNIAGGIFDSLRMVSNSDAFEFANLSTDRALINAAAPVPLPAGGLLLVSAIGGIAALRRRRAAA